MEPTGGILSSNCGGNIELPRIVTMSLGHTSSMFVRDCTWSVTLPIEHSDTLNDCVFKILVLDFGSGVITAVGTFSTASSTIVP